LIGALYLRNGASRDEKGNPYNADVEDRMWNYRLHDASFGSAERWRRIMMVASA
jgi:hypothetical protein